MSGIVPRGKDTMVNKVHIAFNSLLGETENERNSYKWLKKN